MEVKQNNNKKTFSPFCDIEDNRKKCNETHKSVVGNSLSFIFKEAREFV